MCGDGGGSRADISAGGEIEILDKNVLKDDIPLTTRNDWRDADAGNSGRRSELAAEVGTV